MDEERIAAMAKRMRRGILDVCEACKLSAHLGGGLSIVDIMATLYGAVLRYDASNPVWEERDRFILSKGHGALGYYSALWAAGIISDEVFASFQTNESDLIAHPVMNPLLGIESSNGSLGQGLSMGIGLALAARKKGAPYRVFVLLGDGECNEGSVWEAIMAGAHFELDNLVAIVDRNSFQSDGKGDVIMGLGDLAKRWECFGWNVRAVDGHDVAAVYQALAGPAVEAKPTVVVARTTKGKGVPFMENNNDWHHNRLTRAQYEQALREMGET